MLGPRSRQQNSEFIYADPRQTCGWHDLLLQAFRQRDKETVALTVAEYLVDVAKTVHVQHQQCQRALLLTDVVDFAAQPIAQARAVRQTREGVDEGHALDGALRFALPQPHPQVRDSK